jgi:biotin-(acetyl-CoA carboxylase) ligase/biotin operon repressor
MPSTATAHTTTILRAFLAADGAPVSGDKLARALGISRVSVHARLEQLRREGFVFAAAPRVGYKLTTVPAALHPAFLTAWQHHLAPPAAPILPAHCLASVDSTNDEAARRLSAGEPAPFAVLAGAQTRGRGRLGRPWESRDTGGLYMSFAFRPMFTPGNVQSVTLAIGLRLCAALADRYALPLRIKWPNDILCADPPPPAPATATAAATTAVQRPTVPPASGVQSPASSLPPAAPIIPITPTIPIIPITPIIPTPALPASPAPARKIAGILAEARMDSDQVRDIIFGIGLNVNTPPSAFPPDLRARAGSLSQIAGRTFDINEVAALCAATVATAFDAFLRDGFGSDFTELWHRHDYLIGKTVTARSGHRELTGEVLGLTETGALLLRDPTGTLHPLNSGEVTLSPPTPAAE